MYLRRGGGREGGRGGGEGDVFDLPFSKGLGVNVSSFCCVRDGVWAGLMGREWRATVWVKTEEEEVEGGREGGGENSTDVCRYPYRNAYWSCC